MNENHKSIFEKALENLNHPLLSEITRRTTYRGHSPGVKPTTGIKLNLPKTSTMAAKMERVLADKSPEGRKRMKQMNNLVIGREEDGDKITLEFKTTASRERFRKMMNELSENVQLDEGSEITFSFDNPMKAGAFASRIMRDKLASEVDRYVSGRKEMVQVIMHPNDYERNDIEKLAKQYKGQLREDLQLDETNFRFPQPGEDYGELGMSINDPDSFSGSGPSRSELKKRSQDIQRKFASVMRKHKRTKVGEVLDILDKDGGTKLYKDSDIKQISKYLTKHKDNVRKVAHQMLIDYMEGDDYLAKKRIPVKEDVQEGKKMKVKLDPNKSMDKVVKTLEDKMTDAEMDKREKIVKSMKKKKDDFKARYGDQADDVMYATATKMAMKDSYELEDGSTINESFESEFPTSQVETLAANMTPVVRDRWVIKEAPFDDIKKIVADKSMMTVKFPDGKQKVDMMTANVLMTVYDALNDKNKKKFVEKINAKMGNFLKLVQFAYSAVNPK